MLEWLLVVVTVVGNPPYHNAIKPQSVAEFPSRLACEESQKLSLNALAGTDDEDLIMVCMPSIKREL